MKEENPDLTLEAFTDFLNAVEAGIEAARQTIKTAKKIDEPKQDFSMLLWEEKSGKKGPFQQTSEKSNNNSGLWKELQAKLKEHMGFWQNQGFQYWFDMTQETVIDRRQCGEEGTSEA